MFSIIVPLYNKKEYVLKTITSILTQTFREFELIIIDDGSTDGSLDIVRKIDYNNIDIKIVHQENCGVSATKNLGASLAKFDFITFLDSDDFWESCFLKEMCSMIKEFPNVAIWSSSYYIVKNSLKKKAKIGLPDDFSKGYINYFNVYAENLIMPIWTGATIIKKDVFFSVGMFNPVLKLGEDFDLWIKINLKYKTAFLNKPLSNYNQDVEIINRAIGFKFYKPDEHVLFYDYSKAENASLNILLEKLRIYALYPYYIFEKNKNQVNYLINNISNSHLKFEDNLKFRYLPKFVQRYIFLFFIKLSKLKNWIIVKTNRINNNNIKLI